MTHLLATTISFQTNSIRMIVRSHAGDIVLLRTRILTAANVVDAASIRSDASSVGHVESSYAGNHAVAELAF